MPGFFAFGLTDEEVFIQPCQIIKDVDNWLNGQAQMTQTASALGEARTFAFEPGGPLEHQEDEARWDTNWVNAEGHGGLYWPWATDVNISDLVKNGLAESVQLASSTNKLHNTLWVVSGPPPAGDIDADTQRRLFRVGVHETDHVVSLVIMTPTPLNPS